MEVDLPRKRIALSMRLTDEAAREDKPGKSDKPKNKPANKQQKQAHKQAPRHAKTKTRSEQPINSAMAQAFAKLKN